MKPLNVLLKELKSRPVTLLMLQMCLTCLFSLFPCCAGRLLASFRSSFSHLVPDGTSEVYVKKTKAPETSIVWREEQKQNIPVSVQPQSGMRKVGWEITSETLRLRWELCSSLWTWWRLLGSLGLQEERIEAGWRGVWSEASECDVFIGLLLSDCLICLPAHCLCQLFKGISLQVQLRRESLVHSTCFVVLPIFAMCVGFRCEAGSP